MGRKMNTSKEKKEINYDISMCILVQGERWGNKELKARNQQEKTVDASAVSKRILW
jgi:hypothetical protein